MNILINCELYEFVKYKRILGGIETLCLELSYFLKKRGYRVYFTSKSNKNLTKNKIKFISINNKIIKKKNINFKVVISANDAKIFNSFPKSKKILWLHNPLQIEKSLRKKQLFSILKNKITAVFVSKYLENITSKFYFFKKKKIISNFLSKDFSSIKKNNTNRKKIIVWSVQRDRGLTNTIDMWIRFVNPQHPQAKFYIFGINNKKILKQNRFKKKNIFFFGKVSKKILKKTYINSTAMICLGYDETFCLNALEANSCGLPVITFGKTALKELIKDNYNGKVVKNFDDMSFAINKLLTNSQKKLSSNSLNFSKKYNINKIGLKWLNLIEKQ